MCDQAPQLAEHLAGFRRRMRLLLAERLACWGLATAGLVAALACLVDRLTDWYITPEGLLLLALLGTLVGIIMARLRPLTDLAVALTLERRHHLHERASTAVVLQESPEAHPEFRTLVTADALSHLAGLEPRRIFPRLFARHHQAALLAWALALVLFLLPSIPWFQSPDTRAEQAQMAQAGKALQQQAREIRQRKELKQSVVARQVARNMQRLGVELEKQRLPRKAAMIRLNKLETQLAKAEEALQREELQRAMPGLKEAASRVQQALQARTPQEKAAAQSARDKLAKGATKAQLTREEREALQQEETLQKLAQQLKQGNMQAAQATLGQMGQMLQQSQQLTPAQQQQLAQAMQKLAQAMQKTSNQQLAKAAQQASKSLCQGNKQGQCNAGKALASMPSQHTPTQFSLSQARQGVQNALMSMRPCQNACNKPGGSCSTSGKGSGRPVVYKPLPKGQVTQGANLGKNPYSSLGAGVEQKYDPSQLDERALEQGITVNISTGPEKSESTRVPYYDVYADYRKSAESAIEQEQVPPSERQRVKAYFDALDPGAE